MKRGPQYGATGFSTRLVDPVTGNVLQPCSATEADVMRYFFWLPGHVKLVHRVELNQADTIRIAAALGVAHLVLRDGTLATMATDFVETRKGKIMQKMFACTVKNNTDLSARTLNLLKIEQAFWEEKGIPWRLIFRSSIPTNRIENVRWFESFGPRSILIPLRHRAVEIEAALYPMVVAGVRLNEACARVDACLSLPQGTALTHVRMFLHTAVWAVDLDVRINPMAPLLITTRNISKL